MRWRKVTLIGVGLLGGSLGLALKRRALAGHIEGYVRRESSIEECLRAGAVSAATCDLLSAVENADLIVFCTPLSQMPPLARQMLPALQKGAIATDVGSVKGGLVRQLQEILKPKGVEFVGSHPMAGSEKMGVSAARADLFDDSTCVVTSTDQNSAGAILRIEELWRSVGGRVLQVSPELHDELVSRSSHLPHIIAAELANYVLGPDRPSEQSKLCANGFRDSTRVAAGSPEMWRDIVAANRHQITRALDDFLGNLNRFRELLKRNDSAELEAFFREAKHRRDSWAAQSASPSPE